jgi:hypothetical protein
MSASRAFFALGGFAGALALGLSADLGLSAADATLAIAFDFGVAVDLPLGFSLVFKATPS